MDALNQADGDLSYGQVSRVVRDVNIEARKEKKSVSEMTRIVCGPYLAECAVNLLHEKEYTWAMGLSPCIEYRLDMSCWCSSARASASSISPQTSQELLPPTN